MRSNHGQHNDFNDEYENVYANTQIYANANTLAAANDYANANCTIPIGKKPALPPKPSSQANTLKRNRPSTSTTIPATPVMVTSIAVAPAMDSINQNSMGKDPAEMSLRERLALFEQSTQRISDPIVAEPRVQIPMPPLPLPKKHLPNSTTEKIEYSTVVRGMPSDHLAKSKYRVHVCEFCTSVNFKLLFSFVSNSQLLVRCRSQCNQIDRQYFHWHIQRHHRRPYPPRRNRCRPPKFNRNNSNWLASWTMAPETPVSFHWMVILICVFLLSARQNHKFNFDCVILM